MSKNSTRRVRKQAGTAEVRGLDADERVLAQHRDVERRGGDHLDSRREAHLGDRLKAVMEPRHAGAFFGNGCDERDLRNCHCRCNA